MKEKKFRLIQQRNSLVLMNGGATVAKLTLLTLMAVFVESANQRNNEKKVSLPKHRYFKSLKTNGNVLNALLSTKLTGIVTFKHVALFAMRQTH
jgi:hypothetical protein